NGTPGKIRVARPVVARDGSEIIDGVRGNVGLLRAGRVEQSDLSARFPDESVIVEEGGTVVISREQKVTDHHAPKIDGVAIATVEIRDDDVMEGSVWIPDIGDVEEGDADDDGGAHRSNNCAQRVEPRHAGAVSQRAVSTGKRVVERHEFVIGVAQETMAHAVIITRDSGNHAETINADTKRPLSGPGCVSCSRGIEDLDIGRLAGAGGAQPDRTDDDAQCDYSADFPWIGHGEYSLLAVNGSAPRCRGIYSRFVCCSASVDGSECACCAPISAVKPPMSTTPPLFCTATCAFLNRCKVRLPRLARAHIKRFCRRDC